MACADTFINFLQLSVTSKYRERVFTLITTTALDVRKPKSDAESFKIINFIKEKIILKHFF